MLGFAARSLLLSAVCGAAVAPAPASVNATEAASRLEALVSDMAESQAGLVEKAADAPTPVMIDDDVVIMEEGSVHGRSLGACNCAGGYRNGASASTAVCAKREGARGNFVCYPTMSNGQCSDQTASLCRRGSANPVSSPAPVTIGRALGDIVDAETPEAVMPAVNYLSVNLQLHEPSTSTSQLPTADDFARALATLTSVNHNHVSVLVDAAGATARTTATVHATFALHGESHAERRKALESMLSTSSQLPAIAGHTYQVVGMQVYEQSSHPLVCGPDGSSRKPSEADLLSQLVELKRQEVALMRQAVTQQQNAGVQSALLQRIANRLGLSAA